MGIKNIAARRTTREKFVFENLADWSDNFLYNLGGGKKSVKAMERYFLRGQSWP